MNKVNATEDATAAATAASHAPEVKAVQEQGGATLAKPTLPVTMGSVLVACAFTLFIAWFLPGVLARLGVHLPGMGGAAASESLVVFLDVEKVLAAGIKSNLEKSPEDALNAAAQFPQQFAAMLKHYTDRGYIVLTSKAVVEGADQHDITEDAIAYLGRK